MRTPTKRAGSPKKGSTFSSSAGMNVKRFGQATFTSMRSMRESKNGNNQTKLVPIVKQADDILVKKDEPAMPSTATTPTDAKPKVYKFFKSRQTPNQSAPSENKSPIKIKEDVTKRIVAPPPKPSTQRINRTSKAALSTQEHQQQPQQQKPAIQATVQVKIAPVERVKKTPVMPSKKAQSNIKNVTAKPTMQTPEKLISLKPGVRTSRRLQGILPDEHERNMRQFSRSLTRTTRNAFKESESEDDQPQQTTLIERVEDDEPEYMEETDDSSVQQVADEPELEPQPEMMEVDDVTLQESQPSPPPTIPEEVQPTKPTQPVKIQQDFVLLPSSEEEDDDDAEDELKIHQKFVLLPSPSPEPEQPPESEAEIIQEEVTVQEEVSTAPIATSTTNPTETKEESKQQQPVKKKTFFNRKDRKAEFNAKSFFAAEKDEFDLEIESQQQQAASSQTTNSQTSEKRSDTKDDEDEDMLAKLKRVKKAHQCHDLGETAQFDQDIRYYLSGINEKNSNSIRCLSILGLAEKAMKPEFRMQLRAHDDMPRINKALIDAPQEPNLAFCASALMFVYNQDRLRMDIDPNALSLILALLESQNEEEEKVDAKHKDTVVRLVEELKKKGHAQYLKLSDVSAGKLAMETLLGLTSKRAGDWFKEELRKTNGIDFLLNTVIRYSENSHEESQMVKIDRCMHVLENVAFNNVPNQIFITEYNDRKFISTCIDLMKSCKEVIVTGREAKVFISLLFSLLRVFTSLTTESVVGCQSIGSFDDILELLLSFAFELPTFIQIDQRFDLSIIVFCLGINLVEFREEIRDKIMSSDTHLKALCEFLFKKIAEADQVDKATDEMLDSHENVQMTEAMQDNLLKQMISKSGTHMEHSLLAACVCLLFGCCIQDNREYTKRLIDALPDHSFNPLIVMLEKLRDFAHLADIMTKKGKERVQKVLSIFKRYKIQEESEEFDD